MAQKPRTYWQKRFEIYEQRANLKSQSHLNDLAKQYRAAIRETEKELAVFYNRLAANNDLPSIAAAKKLLSVDELADFKMDLATYTRLAKENGITGDWTKMLENASLKHRISRLEAMKLQMEHHATQLMRGQLTGLESFTRSAYETAYYNGAFEIAKGTGIGKTLFQLDDKRINAVIHRPWAADGRNFSERVWGQHRPQLVQNLHRDLTRSLMRGEGPDKAIKAISHDFEVSLSAAARLVQTEESYFTSVAQKDVFSDLDVEQYEIIATLDGHTSDICQDLDGKVFKMSEFEAGVTAPPFHVRCRTTTAPYFDDEIDATRAARDPETGQTVQVPADMKYQDWKDQYTVDPETGKTNAQLKAEQKAKEEAEAKARAEAEKRAAEEAARAKAEAERKAREQAEAKAKAEAEARAKAEAEAAQRAKEAEKSAFVPAKTMDEVRERIALKTGTQPDINKISLEAANAVDEKYSKILEKFPQFAGRFGVVSDDTKRYKIGKNAYAAASVGPTPKMVINPSKFKGKSFSAKDSFAFDVEQGFHPVALDWKSTFTHEAGHQIANIMYSVEFPDSIHEVYHVRDYCQRIMNWTLQRAGTSDIAKGLSVYATRNTSEFFAEAFAEYMDSPNPRPIAKAFGEVLEEQIGRIFK